MLRTFTPADCYRGLADEPFPTEQSSVSLGRMTVIYGRNGSGKSTFSEYLRGFSNGTRSRIDFRGTCFDRDNSRIHSGIIPEEIVDDIHIYNRFYVEENLRPFLNGDALSDPIVVLGKANIDAQKDIISVQATREAERERLGKAKKKFEDASRMHRETVSNVKNEVIRCLGAVDGATFNTTRYTTTKAETLLRGADHLTLDTGQLASRISVAGEAKKAEVVIGSFPSEDLASLRDKIRSLLGRDVKNISIKALQDNPSLAQWVERGTRLHDPGDTCRFCGEGTVSSETLRTYADHFNESFKRLLTEIDDVHAKVGRINSSLEDVSWMPQVESFLGAFQEEFLLVSSGWIEQARAARVWLREAARFLQRLRQDPLGPQSLPAGLEVVPSLDLLDEIALQVEKNNLACAEQLTAKTDALSDVQVHCATLHRANYRRAKVTQANAERLVTKVEARILLLDSEEHGHRGRMSDTNSMALAIDEDLKRVFGHDHLSVVVSEDSKGYKVIRRQEVAEDLSEGERHAIALLYFIRSLQRDGVTPVDDLVIVDDPVTSLDKEAMFSAFSLLTSRLESFGQLVILTHDYEFFRLFLVAKKSAHDASLKRIGENRVDETAFPAIRFLEIVSARVKGATVRESFLRPLPNALLAHPSEYHYLFWRVALAVAEDDETTLPLLGNAARRLLEGFISFRAPDGAGFQEKINTTAELALAFGEHPPAALVEIRERVTRFAHGASHRGDPSPTSALDFPGVREELKQVLEFMQLCDPQHFERLVKSVGIPYKNLQLRLSQRCESEGNFTSYTYGRLEASSPLVYAEALRPNFVVYGTESPTDLRSLMAQVSGAARNGIWLVATQANSGTQLAVDRYVHRTDSSRSLPAPQNGGYRAYFVSSTGEERWQQDDLHYLECILRRGYADYGFDSVREGPRSTKFPMDSAVCDPVLKELGLVLSTLARMLDGL